MHRGSARRCRAPITTPQRSPVAVANAGHPDRPAPHPGEQRRSRRRQRERAADEHVPPERRDALGRVAVRRRARSASIRSRRPRTRPRSAVRDEPARTLSPDLSRCLLRLPAQNRVKRCRTSIPRGRSWRSSSPHSSRRSTDRFWTHMVQHLLHRRPRHRCSLVPRPGRFPGWRAAPLALPAWAARARSSGTSPLSTTRRSTTARCTCSRTRAFSSRASRVWARSFSGPGAVHRRRGSSAYVIVMWLVTLALSQIFLWSGHSYYDGYTLSDQRAGGGVMLVEGSFVMLGVVVWLLLPSVRRDGGATARARGTASRVRQRAGRAPRRARRRRRSSRTTRCSGSASTTVSMAAIA